MTLKLQVGTSRKVATGDFGSHGANCSIELSLDPLAMEQPDVFQKRLTQLFKTCRQSVQDELERQIGSDRIGQPDRSSPTIRIAHDRVSQNGGGGRRTGRQATEKQMRFVHRLAASISELDDHTLATLCERMFNAQLDNLSSVDASGLIDTLRAISEGKLTLDRLLNRGSVDDAQ